jgi:nucleoid-associated protein YgaU
VSSAATALVLALALGLLAAPAAAEREHVVQPGETLWSIAEEVAGDASLWPLLFRANRDQIGDPGVLHPGQRLTIPDPENAASEALSRDDDVPRIR